MTIVAPTGTLALERMVTGTDSNTWGDRLNANWARIDAANGYVQVDVSGLTVTLTSSDSGDLTSDAQNRFDIIQAIGSPVAQASIVFPAGLVKRYMLLNSTTQSVTFQGSGRPGVTLPPNSTMNVWSNGQDIVTAGSVSGPIYINDPNTSDLAAIVISAPADVNGAAIKLIGPGGIAKTLRVLNGQFSIVNNAYNAQLLTLDDGGNLGVTGAINSGTSITATGNIVSNVGTVSGAYLQSTGNAGIVGALNVTGAITSSYIHSTGAGNIDGNLVCGAVTAGYVHSTGTGNVDGNFVCGSVSTGYLHCFGDSNIDGPNLFIGSSTLIYDGGSVINFRAGNTGIYGYYNMDFAGNAHALNGAWINGSDIKLKTNVETISGALALVCSMRGVTYDDYKSGAHRIGVIGNEMLEVLPAATSSFEHPDFTDGPLVGVNYGGLVGPLIEAIKELAAKNEALSARLAAAGL
jgi:hypothetical protein